MNSKYSQLVFEGSAVQMHLVELALKNHGIECRCSEAVVEGFRVFTKSKVFVSEEDEPEAIKIADACLGSTTPPFRLTMLSGVLISIITLLFIALIAVRFFWNG